MVLTSSSSPAASDCVRGICRMLAVQGWAPLTELVLADGLRADVMAIAASGEILIAEVKVSASDLRSDRKWPGYRAWCDAFFWVVPEPLRALLDDARFAPAEAGLIVADRHEAACVRDAARVPLAPARRRAVTLRFARAAALRAARLLDPGLPAASRGW
ncbi:MmcB family DNA repair protein [Thermaurantiacus sp.]